MALHVPNFARYVDNSISDTLVNVQSAPSTRNLPIMCVYSYKERDPPARRSTSKWYMSKLRYSPEYWPPYCKGDWYSMPVELAGKLFRISQRMEYLILDDVWITGLMRIKYLAGVRLSGNHIAAESIIRLALHAAPLALRTDWELGKNINESAAQVIVSHAWGNVENREVNVPQMLRNSWEKWSCSFPEEKVNLLTWRGSGTALIYYILKKQRAVRGGTWGSASRVVRMSKFNIKTFDDYGILYRCPWLSNL